MADRIFASVVNQKSVTQNSTTVNINLE